MENLKRYCGILPYFGSTSYLYQRMPRGLNISPSIWQSFINAILDCLQSRKYYEAIMDNLLLFTPTKKSHIARLEDLLKTLHPLLKDTFSVLGSSRCEVLSVLDLKDTEQNRLPLE